MRRQDDIVHRQERIAGGQGLRFEHVQPGAGNAAGSKRIDQGLLVDDRASGCVDEDRGRLHQAELPLAHDMPPPVGRAPTGFIQTYSMDCGRIPRPQAAVRMGGPGKTETGNPRNADACRHLPDSVLSG